MIKNQIKIFQEEVRTAYTNLNIVQFAERLEREVEWIDGRPSDVWIEETWNRFQNLAKAMSHFDSETLQKIIYGKEGEQ